MLSKSEKEFLKSKMPNISFEYKSVIKHRILKKLRKTIDEIQLLLKNQIIFNDSKVYLDEFIKLKKSLGVVLTLLN